MCSVGMVRVAVSRSKTERRQTALRGQALTRSHVRTASSLPPSGECWTSRLRNLSVPTNRSRKSMSSASAEERRTTRPAPWESRPACAFGVALVAAAPASVSLHSVVGPQQSCCSLPSQRLVQSRTDSFGFDVNSSVTGLGANPTMVGVGRVPQRDE